MSVTEETVKELIRAGISTSTGLKNYDLQELAKQVVPVVTPLINSLPRVKGNGDTATNWKTITKINASGLSAGVGEGQRNAFNDTLMVDKSAFYKTLGHDDFVNDQAVWAGQGFDNIPAIVKRNLLLALKISEERVVYGGLGTYGLGTSPTPTVTTATTGGSLPPATAYEVYIVALSHYGWKNSSLANGVFLSSTRNNAGGSTITQVGGYAAKSSAGSITTGGSGSVHKLTWSVTQKLGAAAYAVFVGANASTARLYGITMLPGGDITSIPTTTQLLSALASTDQSQDSLVFDGFASQLAASGFGGYQKTYAGAALSSDGGAGISQYNDAFQWWWDNWKLSPDKLYVSGSKAVALDKIIVANGGAPILRVNTTPGGATQAGRGGRITSILNKVTNTEVEIVVHPDAPDTWDLFTSSSVPFPTSNIGSPAEIHVRKDYHGEDWPRTNKRYEYGVYTDEALPIYAEGAFGLIQGLTA